MVYKNKIVQGDAVAFQAFWEEVLLGRTIKNLQFENGTVSAIVLDNEEVLHTPPTEPMYVNAAFEET